MKEFITDSIYFKKNHEDFLFFANEIFKWKICDIDNSLEYKKSGTYEKEKNITALVSASNYRLQYDIFNIDRKASFYKPEYNKEGFYNKYYPDRKEVFNEFSKYMKRSYISYLSYDSLKNIGLKRLEQLLILMSGVSFQKKKIYDNLFINEFVIDRVQKSTDRITKQDKKVSLIRFLYTVYRELNYEFLDVFSYILKLYSDLKCSDPFDRNGFIIFEDNNELYKIYKEISETEVMIERYLIGNNQNKIIVNKGIGTYSNIIHNYYLLQKEDYFINKTLSSEEESPSIIEVINYLQRIIPLKDLFLSIHLLNKMNKINISNFHIYIKNSLKNRLNLKENKEWISLSLWEQIYRNEDFLFGNIITPLNIEKLSFECPICGNNVYSITPEKLFCGQLNCDFVFNRTNLKKIGIKRVSLANMIEALKNKSLLIETDNKEKNILLFLNKNKNFYSLWIK